MPLSLPGNIPVAARSLAALRKIGAPVRLSGFTLSRAFILAATDDIDPHSVWAAPALRNYRAVWNAACRAKFVDDLSEWGDNVDVDHVFPTSWAKASTTQVAYVRLFPVWAEVNRGAGAGREKAALKAGAGRPAPVGHAYPQERIGVGVARNCWEQREPGTCGGSIKSKSLVFGTSPHRGQRAARQHPDSELPDGPLPWLPEYSKQPGKFEP